MKEQLNELIDQSRSCFNCKNKSFCFINKSLQEFLIKTNPNFNDNFISLDNYFLLTANLCTSYKDQIEEKPIPVYKCLRCEWTDTEEKLEEKVTDKGLKTMKGCPKCKGNVEMIK